MTRAKFTCTEVTKKLHWDGTKRFIYTARMVAVTSGSEENKKFFSYTPSATIELSAFVEDHFIPGNEYYVDFTEANKE